MDYLRDVGPIVRYLDSRIVYRYSQAKSPIKLHLIWSIIRFLLRRPIPCTDFSRANSAQVKDVHVSYPSSFAVQSFNIQVQMTRFIVEAEFYHAMKLERIVDW